MLISSVNSDLLMLLLCILVIHVLLICSFMSLTVQEQMPNFIWVMSRISMIIVVGHFIFLYQYNLSVYSYFERLGFI